MKKIMICFAVCIIGVSSTSAQSDSSRWSFNPDVNFYLIPDDFFVLPVFRADKNWLHLEARYNYEDRQTFSGWFGYNFMGGKKLEYTITPMIGGVVGLSNGISPGLEITLSYKNFELYTEAENYFDLETSENNFFYNWTDLTYSPTDWLWFGISGQRTRLYQTDLDIQRGLLIGAGVKNLELTTYCYNLGFDDPFFLITLSANF
ncbi:MAG TPA: hypothetical protein PKU83_00925 [Chryseolinea sp.]|nr:hypothetical protein [Chryseolinea sp.]